MSDADWKVAEHGPIQELEDNLWVVDATLPGLPIGRRMTLIRLGDGSVVVHSAVCLEEEAQRKVEAWGNVRYIVVPNGWHRIDAPRYAARYREARVLCPDPARKRVEQVVKVDGSLTLLPADAALSGAPLAGSKIEEHVLVARSRERASLVFTDSLMNLPHLPGFKGFLYNAIGSTGAPMVTPIARLAMVRDKAALRAHLEKLSATSGLTRLIPGHGAIIEGAHEAPTVMRAVAARL